MQTFEQELIEVLHTQPADTCSYCATVTVPVSHSTEVLHTQTVGSCSSAAPVTGLVTVPLTYQANHFYPTVNPFSKGITVNTRGKRFFLINPTIPAAAIDLHTWWRGIDDGVLI